MAEAEHNPTPEPRDLRLAIHFGPGVRKTHVVERVGGFSKGLYLCGRDAAGVKAVTDTHERVPEWMIRGEPASDQICVNCLRLVREA